MEASGSSSNSDGSIGAGGQDRDLEGELKLEEKRPSQVLFDTLLDLCPSISSVQAVALAPADEFPGGEATRKKRLAKIVLRAASSGDTELLSWIIYVRSRAKQARANGEDGSSSSSNGSAVPPEGWAFEGIDISQLRDEEGTGPVVLAASSGHAEAVRILVGSGADVDERDACESHVLQICTRCP